MPNPFESKRKKSVGYNIVTIGGQPSSPQPQSLRSMHQQLQQKTRQGQSEFARRAIRLKDGPQPSTTSDHHASPAHQPQDEVREE